MADPAFAACSSATRVAIAPTDLRDDRGVIRETTGLGVTEPFVYRSHKALPLRELVEDAWRHANTGWPAVLGYHDRLAGGCTALQPLGRLSLERAYRNDVLRDTQSPRQEPPNSDLVADRIRAHTKQLISLPGAAQ